MKQCEEIDISRHSRIKTETVETTVVIHLPCCSITQKQCHVKIKFFLLARDAIFVDIKTEENSNDCYFNQLASHLKEFKLLEKTYSIIEYSEEYQLI